MKNSEIGKFFEISKNEKKKNQKIENSTKIQKNLKNHKIHTISQIQHINALCGLIKAFIKVAIIVIIV